MEKIEYLAHFQRLVSIIAFDSSASTEMFGSDAALRANGSEEIPGPDSTPPETYSFYAFILSSVASVTSLGVSATTFDRKESTELTTYFFPASPAASTPTKTTFFLQGGQKYPRCFLRTCACCCFYNS